MVLTIVIPTNVTSNYDQIHDFCENKLSLFHGLNYMNISVLIVLFIATFYCLYFAVVRLRQRKFFVTFYSLNLLSNVTSIAFFTLSNFDCVQIQKYKHVEEYILNGAFKKTSIVLFWQYTCYYTSLSLYSIVVLLFSSKYLAVSLMIANQFTNESV